jgi:hypothetical protein
VGSAEAHQRRCEDARLGGHSPCVLRSGFRCRGSIRIMRWCFYAYSEPWICGCAATRAPSVLAAHRAFCARRTCLCARGALPTPDRVPPRLRSLDPQQENVIRELLEVLAFSAESIGQRQTCSWSGRCRKPVVGHIRPSSSAPGFPHSRHSGSCICSRWSCVASAGTICVGT